MMTWQARPTTYNGIKMRSRLEARFAAFLDEMQVPWEYEPRAYASRAGQYLPDFQLIPEAWESDGGPPMFVEVKPTLAAAYAAMDRMEIIWASEPRAILLVLVDGERHGFKGKYGDWDYVRDGLALWWSPDYDAD